ncbi:DNA ligase D [Cupriavidus sp. WKF15]|uniref:DNA ligase D n=1 Tax=Cupriavidus sp. WKF15 TaxID=3032282 RepID=UPI0023E1AE87|nr:DNA ligase D [Cupriavidus sp. WKF15]WER48845.1 DNA ligase D [Cupriavidus sp. WKF15]
MARNSLERYREKRDFGITAEPPARARARRGKAPLRFVVQKHWARRLHYDFRLELDGVLLSWAVPKGPSFDPSEKRIAIHVEDHPVDYAGFEGVIPPKQYGAGSVIVWDNGTWEPVGDAHAGMAQGKLEFALHGQKLAGRWELVRIAKPGEPDDQWMLFKKRDRWARPHAEYDVITALPDSVVAHPLGPLEGREDSSGTGSRQGADLSAAVPGTAPARLVPQLATPTAKLPAGNGWIIETKFDGYRLLARISDARVRLITRNGHDWTRKLASLAREVEKLDISEGWLDGEIVVLRDGLPDFNALQNAIDGGHNERILYFVFDIPYWEGKDLRRVPLLERRAHLARLVDARSERVRFSESFDAPAAQVFQAAAELGLEGLMLKRDDSPYTSSRNTDWLKAKCRLRQEFVICGFADREGAPGEIGSLLLAVNEDGKLRDVGSVGTGWDSKTAAALRTRLAKLTVDAAPFPVSPTGRSRWGPTRTSAPHWVKPSLVAEVEFADWTPAGQIRQASFKSLRSETPASDVRREAVRVDPGAVGVTVKVTNPERVIDATTGITKLDLVRYYESVADWMLPHLAARPVALLRAPDGIAGEVFFQKHAETTKLPGLREHPAALWPGHGRLLTVDSAEALLAAAQLNVVEFHTWNSTVADIGHPDRVIFDLDPGEGVSWRHVQEAALLMQTLLGELGLAAWLKTSGGKGLHVVVPLVPELDYDTVKDFSRAAVLHLARTIPQRFVSRAGAGNRKGKVFVDYLRNGVGQTTAAAFSARARPGMGVSMPLSWDQLPQLRSADQWSVRNAREYLSFRTHDPWSDFWSTAQSLKGAIEHLG